MEHPIVFSTDNNYLPFVGVALQSLLNHIEPDDKFHVYIFHKRLSDTNRSKIKNMETSNLKISFFNIQDFLKIDNKLLKTRAHYTEEMYYRCLIPSLFAQYQKVLYVDCDLVFNVNPKVFFDIDIGNSLMGVVHDIGVLDTSTKNYKYVKSIGVKPEQYFNSGVLIMNIPELCNFNLYEHFLNIISQGKTFLFPDQDILNIICSNKICFLDYRYNFQWMSLLNYSSKEDFSDQTLFEKYIKAAQKPYVIHYTGGIKPWGEPAKFLADYFWKHARLSPFYEEILFKSILQKTGNCLNVKKVEYYKYKILSKLPTKKQKHYSKKFDILKTKLESIDRI